MNLTRKTFFFRIILSAAIAALFCCWNLSRTATDLALSNSCFVPVDVTLSKFGTPNMSIELENQNFTLLLDTGYSGYISLSQENANTIECKNFQKMKRCCGVFGKKYEVSQYVIPEIQIASTTFRDLYLDVEPEEFAKESRIMLKGSDMPILAGKLGWKLFKESNLLLDFKHSKIALTNNISMLENENYPLYRFIKIPLYLGRDFVEIELESSRGRLRCMLDTGSTGNLYNTDLNMPVDQMIQKTGYFNCRLKDKDLGKIPFHPFPIKLPVHINAILGMEFFMEHCVFLDFQNENAYILNYAEMN